MFKPGDLVMVVKPQLCCGGDKSVGRIFRVAHIRRVKDAWCQCGDVSDTTLAHYDFENGGFDVKRLRLIPPLSDPITTEREIEHAA